MATERLSMRQTREILRQKWLLGKPYQAIAQSLGIGKGTAHGVVKRAVAAGLDWPTVQTLDEDALEARIYEAGKAMETADPARPWPDCEYIHAERRRTGVTLELLHLEYLDKHPTGYQYTQYCEIYRRWLKKRGLSMRQVHLAGEKMFVDYSGKKPSIIDQKTGEVIEVELFVAVLGASNYTFAEATRSQQVPDWIASHQRAFQFFGGVTAAMVCDQLKSGVTRACRYEPGVQRTYEELAEHYATAILPARPRKPKDKAKVEVAVQIAQRWILARLRNEKFFSLSALNARIAELLHALNHRPMRLYRASRHELFLRLDQPALKPLPQDPFVCGQWKLNARVNIDYHIDLHGHYYSVPYHLRHEIVDARYGDSTVEIFRRGVRVASHPRSSLRGRHTTNPAHMPKAHLRHAQWSPSHLISWGASIGSHTAALVEAILLDRPHPEQGYRSCLGILRLAKTYSPERLEAACTRALIVRARSYHHVQSILRHGLDRQDPQPPEPAAIAPDHEHLRGPSYYQDPAPESSAPGDLQEGGQ